MSGSRPGSPWLPAAPCTPRSCARGPAAGASRGRAAARLVAGALAVLAGVLLAPLTALLGRTAREWATR
ncbi:1-acyl-sn-glycerol-3-phosphate acyltransferase, partial [Streptomyces sp. WAC05374]